MRNGKLYDGTLIKALTCKQKAPGKKIAERRTMGEDKNAMKVECERLPNEYSRGPQGENGGVVAWEDVKGAKTWPGPNCPAVSGFIIRKNSLRL